MLDTPGAQSLKGLFQLGCVPCLVRVSQQYLSVSTGDCKGVGLAGRVPEGPRCRSPAGACCKAADAVGAQGQLAGLTDEQETQEDLDRTWVPMDLLRGTESTRGQPTCPTRAAVPVQIASKQAGRPGLDRLQHLLA